MYTKVFALMIRRKFDPALHQVAFNFQEYNQVRYHLHPGWKIN